MSTIYEIAKESGVSPKTVARILAGESKRSKSRDRVLECARKLSYVRNASAANLRTGKTGLVGVLVPFIDNPYYTQFVQEFHDAFARHDLQPLIACSFGRTAEFDSALRAFRSYNVDAILINSSQGQYSKETLELLDYFKSCGKAVMLIGRNSSELKLDQADIHNEAGIEKAVGYLTAKGHERIGFIGGKPTNQNQSQRLAGYRNGMQAASLPLDEGLISMGEGTPQDAVERAQRMLAEADPRPTALICNNDMMAIAVIKSCLKAGIRVPEDLAIIGFDDIPFASMTDPALTTLRQPITQIADDCVSRVLERLTEKQDSPPRTRLYDVELIVRESA